MEDKYGEPMTFNESLILVHVAPMTAGAEVGSGGYGVAVYGAARGHRRKAVTPSLMADMYTLHRRRRCRTPRPTFGPMAATSWNRYTSICYWSLLYVPLQDEYLDSMFRLW